LFVESGRSTTSEEWSGLLVILITSKSLNEMIQKSSKRKKGGRRSNFELQVVECQNVEKLLKMLTFLTISWQPTSGVKHPSQGLGDSQVGLVRYFLWVSIPFCVSSSKALHFFRLFFLGPLLHELMLRLGNTY
jgi:hypothetical protein